MVEVNHGTSSGYTHGGCRCAGCRRAQADYTREYRRARGAVPRGQRVANEWNPLLADLLNELFPNGLTDDCPARREIAA